MLSQLTRTCNKDHKGASDNLLFVSLFDNRSWSSQIHNRMSLTEINIVNYLPRYHDPTH